MSLETNPRYFPESGIFPIEFSGADSNGHHAAYFVKPEDAESSKYRMHFAIRNIWRQKLTLPAIASPSREDHHLQIRFRPGVIDGRMVRKALPLANELEQQLGSGWIWHDLSTDTRTGEIGVCFSYAPKQHTDDFEWKQGETLSLQLRPFQNAPLSGAFFLKAELDYGKLPELDGSEDTGDNYKIKVRELNLAVVDLSGKTFFPGKVAVLGSNTILNNGQPNSRTIKIWNAVHHSVIPFRSATVDHESGSTITVAVRCHGRGDSAIENHPSVLGLRNELQQMMLTAHPVSAAGAPSTGAWMVKPHLDVPGWLSWEITPNAEAGVTQHEIGRVSDSSDGASNIEALELGLENLQSRAPDGIANVYLHFHHLPGLADHTLMIAFEKTPLVIRDQNVGIGSVPEEGAAGDLQVNGNGRFGSVTSDGNGTFGLINSSGSGKFGSVVSEGQGQFGSISTTGTGEDSIKSAGRIQDKTGELMPVGAIIAFGGTDVPIGWLLCDGRAIDPRTYPDLFSRLPGSAVPDLRDRFIVGAGAKSLGQTGGAARVSLTKDEMPRHSHSLTAFHANFHHDGRATEGSTKDDDDGTFGMQTHDAGGGSSHENLPPYYALTYIIKY